MEAKAYWSAIRSGEVNKLEALLVQKRKGKAANNLNTLNRDDGFLASGLRWGLLHKASYLGHAATVGLLLDHGADINLFAEAEERDRDFGYLTFEP